jgi:hypothetical protein
VIDLLSLLPLTQATPALSNSSAVPEQNFSALLTELVGDFQIPAQIQTLDAAAPLPNVTNVAAPQAAELLPPLTPTALDEELPILDATELTEFVPPVVIPVAFDLKSLSMTPTTAEEPAAGKTQTQTPVARPVLPADAAPQQLENAAGIALPLFIAMRMKEAVPADKTPKQNVTQPIPDAVLEDLKKFELTIKQEAVKPAVEAEIEIEAEKNATMQPLVTTDAIASVQQQQMPLRVMPIERISGEPKHEERKHEPVVAETTEATIAAPATSQTELSRSTTMMEQPRAAQHVEVPNMPKLQVVRTVAMEIGDADSQVIVRIDDRGGSMDMHFGAGSDSMQHSLQSSVEILMESLKEEKIHVSNIEVSRKSPIDKVRRMKETRK